MRSVYLALLFCLCLSACTIGVVNRSALTPGPSPLLTPGSAMATALLTQTPVATPQPTPIVESFPTLTPSPTPTSVPVPTLPAEAIPVTYPLPALPADLYFIREGSLWRWPQAGGDFDLIAAAPEQKSGNHRKLSSPTRGGPPFGVTQYRMTPDGRYLVYVFHDSLRQPYSKLIFHDLTHHTAMTLPVASDVDPIRFNFDITTDGRYVIYFAPGRLPTIGGKAPGLTQTIATPKSDEMGQGMFMSLDVQNFNLEMELGYCAIYTNDVEFIRIECSGFALSPDGKTLAFSDGRGVWLADTTKGPARLLTEHTYGRGGGRCGVWNVESWSPNGQWLLIEVGCYEGSYAAVMNPLTGEVQSVPDTCYYGDFYRDYGWSQNGDYVLASFINPVSDSRYASARLRQVLTKNTLEETMLLSETGSISVWPAHLHDLPDGRIGFSNRQCVDSPALRSGVYAIGRDGSSLSLLSSLPAMMCQPPSGSWVAWSSGQIEWTPDGAAFLYFERDQQTPHQTNLLLGLTDGSVLWDIRDVLEGATDFQWRARSD